MTRVVAAIPTHPGEILRAELAERDWTHDDIADVIGKSKRQIANLCSGKSGITPDTAKLLADAFGQNPEEWMDLQVAYELAKVAQQDRKVAKRAQLYEKAPIREMIRRGWIEEEKDTDKLAEEVCNFLEIDSLDSQPQVKAAARMGTDYKAYNSAQIAWHFRARQIARCVSVGKYNKGRIDNTIINLTRLAFNRADARRVPTFLAEHGIRFVIVEHLSRSKVDGAAFEVEGAPAIAMSLRYDRIDNFWHTLIHEMVHVKYGETSLDIDLIATPDDELPEHERRANREAANYLVSKKKLDSFVLRSRPLYYQKRIVEFSRSCNVHPGIVVGQLQNRDELKYSQMRLLLEKVKDVILGNALTDGWGDYPVIGGSR